MKMRGFAAALLVLFLMFVHGTCVRSAGVSKFLFRKSDQEFDHETGLFSDGVHEEDSSLSGIIVEPVSGGQQEVDFTASNSCDETYGFMPCTKSVVGNLFLVAAYGYLLFIGAKFLSDGSELLLAVLGPGIIGGLLLPILGALPDAMLILGGMDAREGAKIVAKKDVKSKCKDNSEEKT